MEEEKKDQPINLDLICYDFNTDLINMINSYNQKLPVSCIYSILKDVFNQVEHEKDRIILDLLEKRSVEQTQETSVEVPIIRE